MLGFKWISLILPVKMRVRGTGVCKSIVDLLLPSPLQHQKSTPIRKALLPPPLSCLWETLPNIWSNKFFILWKWKVFRSSHLKLFCKKSVLKFMVKILLKIPASLQTVSLQLYLKWTPSQLFFQNTNYSATLREYKLVYFRCAAKICSYWN